MSQIASVNNESVMKIVRHCRHLESLDLSLCTSITDVCIDFIARNVHNLRSLHLVSCSLTDQGRARLVFLVCMCTGVMCESFTYLFVKCCNCFYVKLNVCSYIAQNSILRIAKMLYIYSCQICSIEHHIGFSEKLSTMQLLMHKDNPHIQISISL